jgi:ParB-like chromosome segregation protein Spo0J
MKKQKIPIHCSFNEMVPLDKLKPNPRNPNIHPDNQIEKLSKIIENHGWRHPITVSKRTGFVVAGHCRLYAARLLGVRSVPVDYQNFKNEAEELAVLVADNAIQELAETDSGKLADIAQELGSASYDLSLAAIDAVDLIPAELEYREESIQAYERTHILFSFEPSLLMKIEPHLKAIMEIEGVEYEQGSN